MSDLRPGKGYHFRVLAQNAQGQSLWSQPLQASTAADVPGPPSQPVCSKRSAKGITVKWLAPEVENGAAVVSYRCFRLSVVSGTCNIAMLLLGVQDPTFCCSFLVVPVMFDLQKSVHTDYADLCFRLTAHCNTIIQSAGL